nr:CsgG/HfaB family protein [Dyella sp. RRB7]
MAIRGAFRTSVSLSCCGGLLVAAVLLAACHRDEPATGQDKPAAAATASPPATAPRQKPDFGGVDSRHVEATGEGASLQAAIDNAIRLAIEQVNGKAVAGGTGQWAGSASFASSDEQVDFSSSAYAAWLSSHTAGAVTNFRVLSQKQVDQPSSTSEQSLKASRGESWNKGKLDAAASAEAVNADTRAGAAAGVKGEWDQKRGAEQVDYQSRHTEYASHWEVRIAADVATYREAASAKLTRVVVAMPRMKQAGYRVGDTTIPAEVVAQQVRAKLTDALTQTHRFTVLDRDADADMGDEIERIQAGAAKPADTARLGQQLATDLIVIPTIDRFEYLRHERALRTSDRTLASFSGGGALSFRVVNAVTGQVVMSQSFDYSLPATAPTTLGVSVDGQRLAAEMMDSLDRNIIAAILRGTYPLSVVQLDGRQVVINQGGDAVLAGQNYQAVRLGKELIDPQSGASLGVTEQPCCIVTIERVTPNLSYGHIVDKDFQPDQPFTPGSIELRDPVAAAPAASMQHASRQPAGKHTTKTADADAVKDDANW